MDDKRLHLMGEEKITKALRIMAIPAIIGMLTNSIYNIVDTLFVGQLGKEQLGATGVAFPIFMMIGAFGISIGVGAGSYISRLLGAGDHEQAEKTAMSAIFMATIVGIIVMAAGLIFLDPVLKLFGATPGILPYATEYAEIIFWAGLFTVLNMVFNNILRAEGSVTISMIGLILGAVLNIALDPLFIFTFGMGVKGAAWATFIAKTVSLIFLGGYTFLGKGVLKPKLKEISFDRKIYGEIVRIGTPNLMRTLLVSVSMGLLNNAAGAFSDAAVAAVAVIGRVYSFGFMGIFGLNQAFQPLAGFNYGAHKYGRLKQTIVVTVKAGTAFCLFFTAAMLLFASAVAGAFSKDAQVISIIAKGLRYSAILFPFAGFMVTFNVLFQALGKALPAAFLSVARQGVYYIPVILVLPHIWGLDGVLVAQTLADGLTLLTTVGFGIYILRWINQKIKESGSEPAVE